MFRRGLINHDYRFTDNHCYSIGRNEPPPPRSNDHRSSHRRTDVRQNERTGCPNTSRLSPDNEKTNLGYITREQQTKRHYFSNLPLRSFQTY